MSDGDLEDELTGEGIELRPAGADDADLIRRILAMTISWRDATVPLALPPEVAAYHEGWPRPDDFGVLAFRGIEFAGGAYVRRVGPADGTYGYIAGDYRELGIAVEAAFRGQGIGMFCLAALQAKALQNGIAGISLSVESDNPARRLYTQLGFVLVEDRGSDLLMLWKNPTRG